MILFSVSQAVSCLLYPLLGWMADVYFTRYKFVLLSFTTMILGSVVMAIAAVSIMMFPQLRSVLYSIPALTIVICFIGIGLFESTAIQIGMDQMLEASSDKLSTFIHWYYWSSKLGNLVIIYIGYAVTLYFQNNCIIAINEMHLSTIKIESIAALFSCCLQLVCAGTGLCLLVCYKRQLNIDQTGDHPLKLIYQVLKYAWKHKCPENRSAFTYWEDDIPPRIDLGKNKYGGPFTTEEVEDTKTFLRILIRFLSLLGFHLSDHGYSLILQLASRQCPSSGVVGFVTDPMNLMLTTILIGVPLHQLMVRYCQPYAPNMLKRMGLGLLCCLAKVIVEVVIHATMTNRKVCKNFDKNTIATCYFILTQFDINGTCSAFSEIQDFCPQNNLPFLLMIIPNILQGFAFILVFMTTLEFICAQAPLRLKGLLMHWYLVCLTSYLLPAC